MRQCELFGRPHLKPCKHYAPALITDWLPKGLVRQFPLASCARQYLLTPDFLRTKGVERRMIAISATDHGPARGFGGEGRRG
jgi:hypothetical protein